MVVLICVAIAVFVLSFITKARFGVTGFALLAGVVISQYSSDSATALLGSFGISSDSQTFKIGLAAALMVLPAALAMFSKIKYRGTKRNILGAIYASVFAFILVAVTINGVQASDATAGQVVGLVGQYDATPIIAGAVLALVDLLTFRFPKLHGNGKHK